MRVNESLNWADSSDDGKIGTPVRKSYKQNTQYLWLHCMWVTKEEMEFKMIPGVETPSLKGWVPLMEIDVLRESSSGEWRWWTVGWRSQADRGKLCSVGSSPLKLWTTLSIPKVWVWQWVLIKLFQLFNFCVINNKEVYAFSYYYSMPSVVLLVFY